MNFIKCVADKAPTENHSMQFCTARINSTSDDSIELSLADIE